MTVVELLAPARDAATAMAAIEHGADAVYIGAPAFGARAAAGNSVADIARVVERAHLFGVKVYVTVNTIIYNEELDDVRRLVWQLWDAGVDALIVQDMALLELDLLPIDLHASTQCDARTVAKIRRLAQSGFSQVVLPREFTLEEIRAAADAMPGTSLEVFVHGALCVSYSGDCHAGALLAGRSANRGECPQVCRLQFTLTDRLGRSVSSPDGGTATRHWLSLADLNRLASLRELIEAGVSSFKIEGRLKAADYVKNITLAYSHALDEIALESHGAVRRASYGTIEASFTPDPERSFNRGFTPYFLNSTRQTGLTSWRTPKWVGQKVAEIVAVRGPKLKIKPLAPINNGDGLGYFAADGTFGGFRVNRAEGPWLFPAPTATADWRSLAAGTALYRNSDTAFEALMARDDTARRTIAVSFTLRPLADRRVALDASDERGVRATVVSDVPFADTARSPQAQTRLDILGKLGNTIYRASDVDDGCADMFIPSKDLAALRRRAVEALDRAWRATYTRALRRRSTLPDDALAGTRTSYHDNVANSLAERFYSGHGGAVDGLAAEVEPPVGEALVMTTRYCLRRELGCCLKGTNAHALPDELYLDAPLGRLRLDFDCDACNMKIYTKTLDKSNKTP